jgi:hypothetical protein
MSWIKDRLEVELKAETPDIPRTPEDFSSTRYSVWAGVTGIIERDVLEFNETRRAQFMVSTEGNSIVTVIPKQPPMHTAVVEISPNTGLISVTCPPAGLGIGRRGTFKEVGEKIVSRGDFVGQPEPSGEAMTVEDFSRFVLEPILFPSAG